MSSVTLKNIKKAFDGRVNAIAHLNLTIQHGEFFVLLGPSGCGKTTTLRCIAGLEDPEEGQIFIDNEAVLDKARGKFVNPEKRDIGMVFQSYALWPHMTVWDNIAYPLKTRKRIKEAEKHQIRSVLDLVDLNALTERYPSELSGGQQQRVALARAIVSHPRVLLFDEPLSNLDASLRIKLRLELRRLQKDIGYTAIYVTHDHAEALALADRIGIMRAGDLEQVGTPSEIFLKPKSRYVAEFVGFENIIAAQILAQINDRYAKVSLLHAGEVVAENLPQREVYAPVLLALRASQVIGKIYDPLSDALIGQLQTVGYAGDYYLAIVQLVALIDQTFIQTDIKLQVHLPLSIWGSDLNVVSNAIGQYLTLEIQEGACIVLSDVIEAQSKLAVTPPLEVHYAAL
jgi:iron(III) transport system ATP-binding protein